MTELHINIKNNSKITLPDFYDKSMVTVIIRFGSNSTSKESFELKRLMHVEPEDDIPNVLLLNGDLYRYTKIRSLSAIFSGSQIILKPAEQCSETFRGVASIVISHSLSEDTLMKLRDALEFMFRGLQLELEFGSLP